MSDSCGLRKRNVSEGFQHLASMSDSEFEAEFRKFLAKNNQSDISLPSIDKAAIGKMDGGRRRKMKGGDDECSTVVMMAIVLAVGAAIGTGGYLVHCLAGAEMASLGSVISKATGTYVKGIVQAGKGTLLLSNQAIIVAAYKNLAVLRSLATDSWRLVAPMSVSAKTALVELCKKLSPQTKVKTAGGARRRRTYKKRGGSRCGMSGGKKRKSRRGRKSRGRKSRGRKSRGRKSRARRHRR